MQGLAGKERGKTVEFGGRELRVKALGFVSKFDTQASGMASALRYSVEIATTWG